MVSIVTGNGLGLQASSALGLGDNGKLGSASFGQTGEQIYVNAATGNLIVQDRDQMLLGQGVISAIYRAYNSLGQVTGDNWRPGGTRTVTGLTGTLSTIGSTVTLTDWDGSTTVFQYEAYRNSYVSTAWSGANITFASGAAHADAVPTAARATLQFDAASNTWQWRDGSGNLTETYDASQNGRLVSSRDRDGNTVSYVYNAAGRLSQVITAGGDVTNLDYNAAGQLETLRTVTREASGRVVASTGVYYTYDTQGRLSQVIVDLSPDDNSIADGRVFTTTYTYDGSSSRIASITQSDGAQVAFAYVQVDGDYRVATISERGDGGVMRVTSLSYDTMKNQTTVTDPLGYQKILSYDAQGRLTLIQSAPSLNGQVERTWFSYDAHGGYLSTVGSSTGKTLNLTYDGAGNLVRQSDASADITRTYGPNNELLTELVYDKNDPAKPSRTTHYAYDAQGRLRYVVSSEGRITEFRYNAAGQKISELKYTAAAYNLSAMFDGDQPNEAKLNAWVAGINPRDASRADFAYDYRGNVSSVTRYAQLLEDGSGNASGEISQSRYVYDPAGRLLQHIVGTPGQEKVEQFAYDGLGRLLSTTNFAGVQTLYQYDDAQHTVAVTYSNGLTRTSAYNAAGELIAVTNSFAGQIVSQVRNYYDANGQFRMTKNANGQDTHSLYNMRGDVIAQLASDGTLTEYVYDATSARPQRVITYAAKLSEAQLATLTNPDGSPVMAVKGAPLMLMLDSLRPPASASDRSVRAYYTNNGIDHTVDADGVVTQTQYDGSGRPISVTVYANRVDPNAPPSNGLPTPDSENDRTTRYFYDADGLLVGELDTSGYLTEYRYNGAGERIETVRYSRATDASRRSSGTLMSLRPSGDAQDVHVNYVYDGRGHLIAEVDGEGYVTRYRYDTFGNVVERVRGQRIDSRQLSAPQQMTFSFKASAGVPMIVDIVVDGVRAGNVHIKPGAAENYAVTISSAVPLANHTIEFRYGIRREMTISDVTLDDQQGQSIPVTPWFMSGKDGLIATCFTFDVASALAQASTPGELGRTIYAYDALGHLIERTEYSSSGDTTSRYAYDDQGNLIAETARHRAQSYRHDAQGRLVGQLAGEGTAKLQALGANPSQAQIDAIWSQYGVTYRYDAAGNRVAKIDANGNATLYYYDAMGRLSHVVSPMGEVVAYQYDTFGDQTQTTVYATRVSASALAILDGGVLTTDLRATFDALGGDQDSVTRFAYSAAGRLTQRTDAQGFSTFYEYNAFGERSSVLQEISGGVCVRESSAFDKRGNVVVRQKHDVGGVNLMTSVVYDAFGRAVQSTDASGVVRKQQYDRNGNVVVVTDGTGAQSKLTYDAFGNVLTSTDRAGQTTSYSYTPFDREISVTTPEGVRTTTRYDESGQMVALTDGRGNTTSYRYDLDGNLVEVAAPAGTTTQKYDVAGHLIEVSDARGIKTLLSYDAAGRVLSRTVDPNGLRLVTTYVYDAKGQVISVTDPSGMVTQTRYDRNGQTVAIVQDPGGLNLTTTFTYNGLGNVLTVMEGAGSAAQRVTEHVYDKAGRLVSKIVDPAGLRLTTSYTYDKNGNVLTSTDAAGVVTRFAYDAEGRQALSVDPTGAAVEQVFDAEGRVVLRRAYSTPLDFASLPDPVQASDLAVHVTATPQDQIVRYAHDADGQLRYVVDGIGNVTAFTYDANGNVIATTGYARAIAAGGIMSALDVTAALQTSAHDRTTHTVFDAANRPVFTIDPSGYVTANRYDASGNLIEQLQLATRYTGEATEPGVTAWLATAANPTTDRVTTWAYDASNRLAYAIDAEGYVSASRFDAAGRLVATVRYSAADSAARSLSVTQLDNRFPANPPADAVVTQYRYDSAGRLSDTIDALGFVTHDVLNALGQAIDTVVAYGTDQAVTTHREYDSAGRLLQETRAAGTDLAVSTRYTYDAMGRLLTVTDPRGLELVTRDTDWAVAERLAHGVVAKAADLSDSVRAMLMALYTTRYTYDANGQVLTETDPLGYTVTHGYDAFGNRISTTNRNGHEMRFQVDAENRVIATYGPGDAIVRTEYNAFGDTVKVTQGNAVTTLTYDQLGRLIQSTDAMGYSEHYAYDGFGNRTSYTNKLGGQFSYTYDRLGRKTSETLPILASRRPVVNRFEYDARGNLTKTIEADAVIGARTISYVYDLLDRQTQVIRTGYALTSPTPTPTETHTYDAQGNVTSITDPNGAQARLFYDALNRLIAQVSPTGTYTAYGYDGVGNRVRERVFADRVPVPVGALPPVEPARTDKTRETRYAYDADNRLIESRVMNVTTGRMNDAAGNTYEIASNSEIVRTWRYDGEGNVVIETDPYGSRIFHYYDAQGSEALRIDALGYGIAWQRDANGNVLQETQFAQRYQDAYSAASDPFMLIQTWQRNGDDRVTNHEWDLNGRMLSETRTAVRYAAVDNNGRLTEQFGDARTAYTYDAEGHLLRKVDANGSQYDFAYDLIGRLTEQKMPQFADYQNRLVRATTKFTYDGLGRVIAEEGLGASGKTDYYRQYSYNGDRLYYSYDEMGGSEYFTGYDAAGNVTNIDFTNVDAEGRTIDVRTRITYDAEGREVSRVTRSYDPNNGKMVDQGPTRELQYNAFGEVIARRTSVGTPSGEWQEYAEYNNAGQVVRTNFDDGISHVFMYDKNGNATLKVESMQADLRKYAIDDILTDVQLNQTFTKYDARNQVVQITQPKVWMGAPQVTFRPVDIDIEGGNFADTLLTVRGWLDAPARPIDGPATSEVAGVSAGGVPVNAGVTADWEVTANQYMWFAGQGVSSGYFQDGVVVRSLTVNVPDLTNVYGAYDIVVRGSYSISGRPGSSGENSYNETYGISAASLPSGIPVTIPVDLTKRTTFSKATNGITVDAWASSFSYSVDIYLIPRSGGGDVHLGKIEKSGQLYSVGSKSDRDATLYPPSKTWDSSILNQAATLEAASNLTTFAQATMPEGGRGVVYYRPAGSNDPFSILPRGGDQSGRTYQVDTANLPYGAYEMWYVSTRADGRLERRDQYTITIPASGHVAPNPLDQHSPYSGPDVHFDATGTYFWRAPGVFDVYSLSASNRALAASAQLRVRPQGATDGWTTIDVGRNGGNGAFSLDFSRLGAGDYDVALTLFDGFGQVLDIVEGKVALRDGHPPVVSLAYFADKRTTVTFTSQPTAAEWILLTYEGNGLKETIRINRMANGEFVWDTRALLLGAGSYAYAITFTAFDATGTPLTMSRGNVTIGETTTGGETGPGLTVELTGSETPSILQFSPIDANDHPVDAAMLKLYYRPAPKTVGDYSAEYAFAEVPRDDQGRFLFDASGLPTQVDYEYYYLAVDAEGNVLADREGFFNTGTRNNSATNVEIDQQIRDTETRRDLTIDRFQTYNAFGEVSSEIWLTQKRNGTIGEWQTNVRELVYNIQGNLVLKREPTVSVTLSNGFQMETRPETTFYYDRTGNLVGLLDANGNLSTQQWNYGLAQPAVARAWDAQGYSKSYGYDTRGNMRVYTDELGRRTDYTYDQWSNLIQVDRPVLANGQRSTERYEYDRRGNRIATTDALGGRSKIYYDNEGRVTRTVSAEGRTVTYDYLWASNIRSVGTTVGGGWALTTTDANGMTLVDHMDIYGRVTWHRDLGGHTFVYAYNWAGLLARQSSAETGQDIEYDYYSNSMVWKVLDRGTGTEALYEYDANGNRTQERFRSIADNYVFARTVVEYDAMNRVTAIRDLKYNVYYEYDAVGNRRRMLAEYHDLLDNHQTYQEYWYEYDQLNRFTVSMGQLSTGRRATSADDASVSIVIGGAGSDGVQLGYNAAGERTLARYASDGRTEMYAYDANGYLTTQTINGKRYAERTNDAMGRVTRYRSYDRDGTTRLVDLERDWDGDGQLRSERDKVAQQTTTYTRMADGTVTRVEQRPTTGPGTSVTTTYTYEWWDSAKQKSVVSQADNPERPGWKPARSLMEYDVNGNLKTVYDDGGEQADKSRRITYWTDQQGQVLRRDELVQVRWGDNWQVLGAAGNYKHEYYYLNGHRVGNVGNDGIDHVDYVQELAGQLGPGSDERYKIFKPVSTADFDENFMRIDNAYPGPASGSWTVRTGDTLQSIASAVWGDATLWYILADANGLKGEDGLKAGQILKIPNKVTNVHNTSETFKPYDPGKAIGNTQPTLPDPPPPPGKNGGCGGLASIIAVVVAVVASVVSYGTFAPYATSLATSVGFSGAAATTAGAVGAGAVAGTVGAVSSQGVMIAGGQQSGFNWNGVALGAVSGAVAGGVTSAMSPAVAGTAGGASSGTSNGFQAAVLQGAVRSVATQGLGVATGLQDRFDWKGVAASAIASGVGYSAGQAVGSAAADAGYSAGVSKFVSGVSGGLSAGVASTLVRGGSLSRDFGAITMDAVAGTIGNMVADNMANRPTSSASSLYGPVGDVNAMTADAVRAYGGDPGQQFATQANWNLQLDAGLREQAFVGGLQDQFGQFANDTLAASRARDAALKQQLGSEFAGSANLALAQQRAEHAAITARQAAAARNGLAGFDLGRGANDWSDDATGFDLGKGARSWADGDTRPALTKTEGGFWRGVAGSPRTVFETAAPLSERIGVGVRAVGEFIADPLIELSNQYRDVFSAASGATGGWRSAFAQQVSDGSYGGAALTEFGMVAGAAPMAGAALKGLAWAAPAAGPMVDAYTARMGMVLNAVPENIGVVSTGKLGLQTLDPTRVSFTQSSVSFGKAGASYNLDTLVKSMSTEGWVGKPIDVVAMPDGTLASIDNTRVLAARRAGIDVEANVRGFNEAITDPVRQLSLTEKGTVPDTWGEAARLRINKTIQNATYPGMNPSWSVRFPYGSIYDPVVKY
ncbi:LysM peptidoglycan-binding domain-containing protein [Burkholderia sp. PU8-34]